MAVFTDPRTIHPVALKLVGEALEALNEQVGDFTQGVAVADAADDTEVVAQLNALLASLRDAGVIAE